MRPRISFSAGKYVDDVDNGQKKDTDDHDDGYKTRVTSIWNLSPERESAEARARPTQT